MTRDQVQIVLVSGGCALGVGVLGLVVAWVIRRSSFFWQLAVVVGVAIGSVLIWRMDRR